LETKLRKCLANVVQVVNLEKQWELARVVAVMFDAHLAYKITDMCLQERKAMHYHVFSAFAQICELVNPDHELDVLADDAVDDWSRVNLEVAWLGPFNTVYVQLKHCGELGPE
jgi:hypothetical protein